MVEKLYSEIVKFFMFNRIFYSRSRLIPHVSLITDQISASFMGQIFSKLFLTIAHSTIIVAYILYVLCMWRRVDRGHSHIAGRLVVYSYMSVCLLKIENNAGKMKLGI